MVEASELSGFRKRNIVSALIDRMKIKLSKMEVDINKLVPPDYTSLLGRYSKGKDLSIWLFIDDIDATFINREDQRLMISTFFSACRNLVQNVKGLKIRSSVRTDVWFIISQYDEALDKCNQYLVDIKWSGAETGLILKRKILSYFRRKYPKEMKYIGWDPRKNETAIFKTVFLVPMSWGSISVAPHKPVHILSAGRPRWAAQLCKLAAKDAYKNNAQPRIGVRNISNVMKSYGNSRLLDLYKEHSHQCPKIKTVIEAFANGPKRYTSHELLYRITDKIIRIEGLPEIDGIESSGDSLFIAYFLYRVGFIHARDENDRTGLNFVSHEDRPTLLTSRANLDDGLSWEIHPSYRDILRIQRE